MTRTVPFDVFSPELLPSETIQWTGRPNPHVIFHAEDTAIIPFSLFWGGFAIFWLLSASGIWDIFSNRPDKTFQWFGIIWGTPFVLVGQYLIWGRFVYARWRKKRTYYAITTRRALIVVHGLRSRDATSAYFENLATIDKKVRSDGIGSIAFGGAVTGEWRWKGNNTPRPPTFDDVDNADNVCQIAIRMQDQGRRQVGQKRGVFSTDFSK